MYRRTWSWIGQTSVFDGGVRRAYTQFDENTQTNVGSKWDIESGEDVSIDIYWIE